MPRTQNYGQALVRELPVCFRVPPVSVDPPRDDFIGQGLLVGDAPIEALRRQDGQFGFRHIQPTAVFRRVVPLEPFNEPACFGGGKSFIERRWPVRVKIVLYESDLRRRWKMRVGQFLEDAREVLRGALIGYLNMPPVFQWREHNEQIGCAIASIFVIMPRDTT